MKKLLIFFAIISTPVLAANTDVGIGYTPATPGNWSVTPTTYADGLDKLAAFGITSVIPISNGGTGQTTANASFAALSPMTTNGDLITRASGVPSRLGIGTTGQVLTVVSGAPSWASNAGGFVVSTISGNTSAVSGTTYLVNTSGGAFNLTLPTPASGAFVRVKDTKGTFNTNNLTIVRSGSEKIENVAASYVASASFSSVTLLSDGTDWFLIY
jgi:hypothetical protein